MSTYSMTKLFQEFVPNSMVKAQLFTRSNLINKIKEHSETINVITAPAFYGKSVLAYQYASLFEADCNVCWLDANKRNFVLSLQKRNLFQKLCVTLRDADVVVLDNLTDIDSTIMRSLVFFLTYLRKYNCQVIITTQAKLNFPEENSLEINYITTQDLLLSDTEMRAAKQFGFEVEKSLEPYAAIPFVFFDAHENIDRYVSCLVDKTNPTFKEIYEALLLCIWQGSLSEFEKCFKKDLLKLFGSLTQLPHFGFNEVTGLFDTIPLSDFQKCKLVKAYLASFTTVFNLSSDEVISNLITLVINRGQFNYAVTLAKTFLSTQEQIRFFRSYARLCDVNGHAEEMVDFVEYMGESNLSTKDDFLLYAQALGNSGDAKRCGMVLSRIGSLREQPSDKPSSLEVEFSKDFAINVLNGFNVKRLGNPFPQKGSIRTKACLLLTLLVLNHKRELSKIWLAHVLWPESEENKRRQNFYNIWSYTKKLFERGKGNCPYFIATPYSIRIDERYVDSDVIVLESICSDLLNQRAPSMGYEKCLEWIEANCSGKLLPGIGCPEVTAQSRVLQSRLVDALVMASENLMRQNKGQLSLRFAEHAFMCDRTREDACYWFMKLLKALGWYTKALNAFNEHKNQMIHKYGVECSRRVVCLYEEILKELS